MSGTFLGMPPFPEAARTALANTQLRTNLAHATTTIRGKRAAVVGEVPLSRLWHAVPSYPTISEVWLRLLETYGRDSA